MQTRDGFCILGSGNQELKPTGAYRRGKQRPSATETGVPSSPLVHQLTQLPGEAKPLPHTRISAYRLLVIVISKNHPVPYLSGCKASNSVSSVPEKRGLPF